MITSDIHYVRKILFNRKAGINIISDAINTNFGNIKDEDYMYHHSITFPSNYKIEYKIRAAHVPSNKISDYNRIILKEYYDTK